MGNIFGYVNRLILPQRCIFCYKPIYTKDAVCNSCRNILPYLGGSDWRRGKNFRYCVSALSYEKNVAPAIHRFKYHGRYHYAAYFASLLARLLAAQRDDFDMITWIPQSLSRTMERGYNHSKLLAVETAKQLEFNKPLKLLRKCRHTERQVMMDKNERTVNLKGSFKAVNRETFLGKRILIIDDVVTTGSTLEECAGVLLEAGASEIVCATVARAMPHAKRP